MIERTERDILRAYRVYKSSDIIRNRVDGEEDSEIYVVVCAFVALYNGITMSELQKVLPLSKNFIKELVKKAVYSYGILDFNGSVVIGHRQFLDNGSKGVISIAQPVQAAINVKTANLRVGRRILTAFASVLSNSSAHIIIMKDNIRNVSNAGVLKHMFTFWLSLLDNSLYSGSEFAKNLSTIGYMRPLNNGGVELNREAVFYNKEPEFEIRTIR